MTRARALAAMWLGAALCVAWAVLTAWHHWRRRLTLAKLIVISRRRAVVAPPEDDVQPADPVLMARMQEADR